MKLLICHFDAKYKLFKAFNFQLRIFFFLLGIFERKYARPEYTLISFDKYNLHKYIDFNLIVKSKRKKGRNKLGERKS